MFHNWLWWSIDTHSDEQIDWSEDTMLTTNWMWPERWARR